MAIAAKHLSGPVAAGNSKSDERLFHENISLAYRMAVKLSRQYQIEQDDAVNEALVGLLQAARQFDPYYGVKFSTFAYQRIKGQIIASHRQYSGFKRWRPENYAGPRCTVVSLFNDTGSVSVEGAVESRLPVGADEPHPLERFLVDPDPSPQDLIEELDLRRWMMAEIPGRMRRLNDQETFVIRQYYWHAHTLRRIGQAMGITEARAGQIHAVALAHLRDPRFQHKHYALKLASRDQWQAQMDRLASQKIS